VTLCRNCQLAVREWHSRSIQAQERIFQLLRKRLAEGLEISPEERAAAGDFARYLPQ